MGGGSSKPRGIRCARKLRNNRRLQRWADLDYKKAHLGTTLKANPFGGSSHAKGIVVEKIGVEAKQPNSAIRKCVRVQLIKNGKRITAFVPCDGSLNYIEEMTKSWSPDSVDLAMPSVISQVSDSRSSKSPVSPSLLSSKARKNDHVTRFLTNRKKSSSNNKKNHQFFDKLFKINIFLFFCSTVMFRLITTVA